LAALRELFVLNASASATAAQQAQPVLRVAGHV